MTFFGIKNWRTLAALWAGTLLCNKKKSQEQNAAGQTQWMRFRRWYITPSSNSAFTVFPSGMNSLCTTPWESKNYQPGLNVGPLEFQFLQPSGCLTNPFRSLLFCFGVIGKTPGLFSHKGFVKKIFVCIRHHDNVLARRDVIFPLLRCKILWNKTCTQLSLSQLLFQNLKNCSIGNVKKFCYHSWCDLTKSATAAMFTSVQVDFGWPPLSSSSTSKSRIPTKNIWSVQSLTPISLLHQY